MNISYFIPMRLNTFECALKYSFRNLFWTFIVHRLPCKVLVGFLFFHAHAVLIGLLPLRPSFIIEFNSFQICFL